MDALIHVASLLRVFSSLQHDLLRLRLLTIVATLCFVVYFATRAEPLLGVVAWNLFFMAVNLVEVGRLLKGRHRSARRHPQRSIQRGLD